MFPFLERFRSLEEVMADHKLAALGDTFVNFVYSLALSKKENRPIGVRVKGSVLSKSLKAAELRGVLPSRINSHTQADAAEALIVYAWMRNIISISETVSILSEADTATEAFSCLLKVIAERIKKRERKGLF